MSNPNLFNGLTPRFRGSFPRLAGTGSSPFPEAHVGRAAVGRDWLGHAHRAVSIANAQ